MLFISRRTRASEIKSMLPSLECYNWLIVMNAQKKHRSFAIQNLLISFKRFVVYVVLADQECLKLEVDLSSQRKESSKILSTHF